MPDNERDDFGRRVAIAPLSQIRLRNFKSVRDSVVDLKNLTVVVGMNSSGKSTLLQSVLALSQAVGQHFTDSKFPLNGEYVKLGTFREVLNFSADPVVDEVSIGFTVNLSQAPIRAGVSPAPGSSRSRAESVSWDGSLSSTAAETEGFARLRGFKLDVSSRGRTGDADRFAIEVESLNSVNREGRRLVVAHSGIRSSGTIIEALGQFSTNEISELPVEGVTLNGALPQIGYAQTTRFKAVANLWWDFYSDNLSELVSEAKATGAVASGSVSLALEMTAVASQDIRNVFSLERNPNVERDDDDMWLVGWPPSMRQSPDRIFQRTLVRLTQEEKEAIARGIAYLDEEKFSRGLYNLFVDSRDFAEGEAIGVSEEVLNRMMPTEDDLAWLNSRWLDQPVFVPLRTENGGDLSDATRRAGYIFERIQYLGPLRMEPQTLHSPSSSKSDIGSNGQFAAAVLHARRNDTVVQPPRGEAPMEPRPTLQSALNYWLVELGLADSASTTDRGRLGIGLEVSPMGTGRSVDLTSVGVGVSQVLPVVILCLLSRPGSIILVEQPELHLHPAMQLRLADFLLACARTGRQIIVETHSEHLVNRLRLRVASGEVANSRELVQLLFAEQVNGTTNYRASTINDLGGLDNEWPSGFLDVGSTEAGQLLRQTVLRHRQSKTEPLNEGNISS